MLGGMLLVPMLVSLSMATDCTLKPTALRCEARVDPLGIDNPAPGLTWKVEASKSGLRDLRQTAYRILVASDRQLIDQGKGDCWDTGKVASSETSNIAYRGKPLMTKRPYWWKVQVWDQAGTESDWSGAASWSMGLLSPSDWKADWIGYDKPLEAKPSVLDFKGAHWIWSPGVKPGAVPTGRAYLRKSIEVTGHVVKAQLLATADDEFELSINGKKAAESDHQSEAWSRPAYQDVTHFLTPGRNEIVVLTDNEQGKEGGFAVKLAITTDDGKTQTIVSDTTWEGSSQPTSGYGAASDIGAFGRAPWGDVKPRDVFLPAPRLLRRAFEATKKVRRATIYATALGMFELHLNGQVVSPDLFAPGWTEYHKRVCYLAYDVTKLVNQGPNVVGAVLADGWYAGYVGFGHHRDNYGDKTRFRGQLELEYEDGTSETMGTSSDWRAQTGATLEADFLMGETCDARLEPRGWDAPGFKADKWDAVDITSKVVPVVEAFTGDPVRAFKELKAVSVTEPTKGVYVLNLGQNIAGMARLRVRGKEGQRVTLRFAERLSPDGNVYTTNLRSARAIDTYTCRGVGEEVWQPQFTFHGFQYIEVTGLGHKPGPDEVVGIAISSATPEAGTLTTSDPMLNKLVSNAWWTQRMNFIDVPTDCPQRDERLGWTGDAQAYIRTATFNTDVQAFFNKWLVSLDDSQREDGQFPMVAPLLVAGPDGGPAWADAGVICPSTAFDVYGDRRLLERHYPNMKKFVDFCKNRSTAALLPPAQFHCFGDWLNINDDTPHEVIYEAYFAGSARLVSQAAHILGNEADARTYGALYDSVKAAFNKAYVSPDGLVKGDSQCAYVLALAFDLVDGDMEKKVEARLIANIEKRNWHLSTGFVGTRDIMHVLSKIGRNDIAFRLLHNTTFPSWGFTIVNGATSIWERWDGWTPEKGFQDAGMNSFAHYAFGAVVGWMYQHIGGIVNTSPGFATVRIAPALDPNLKSATTSYESIRGKIVVDWKVNGPMLSLKVDVPANVEAEIVVPGKAPRPVGGKVGKTNVFKVGSGHYEFTSVVGPLIAR